MSDKELVMAFLKAHQMAVIATNSAEGKSPESALLAFVEDEDLMLYFQTNEATRKARNLMKNQEVSLVIGLDVVEMATLQYEGTAELITDSEEILRCKARFDAKESPSTAEYYERPGTQFYKVTPKWLRLYRAEHAEPIELSF